MWMCELVKQLLAEKLIDDFYEEDLNHVGAGEPALDPLTEVMKALLPLDKHVLLFQWEAQCTETCGEELRRFARFVADLILAHQNKACACQTESTDES